MANEKIVFMGTPVFGKEILKCLVENNYNVVAVVTQPDKLVGRKQVLTFSEVKKYALEHHIDVLQPEKIRNEYQAVLQYQPDLIITCAYGQIIPKEILDYPRLGCKNVHASLLPKLRGGAPIQHSIIDGYDKTGITIMEMAEKMDDGDIISQCETTIELNETYSSLHDKLIPLAQKLLLDSMNVILNQTYQPIKQKQEEVTFGYNISKEEEKIDVNKTYKEVYNQIRGLIKVPYGYLIVDGKKLKICEVQYSDLKDENENGTLIFVNKDLGLVIDKQVIIIKAVQPEGKNIMPAKDFRNGAGKDYNGKKCE